MELVDVILYEGGVKERKRVEINMESSLKELKKVIEDDCGIEEEARKRGMTGNIIIHISRVDKTDGTKVYGITTDRNWITERKDLLSQKDSYLQGKFVRIALWMVSP